MSLKCVRFTVKFQLYSEMCRTRLKAENILLLNKWADGVFQCVLNLITTELGVQIKEVDCYGSA